METLRCGLCDLVFEEKKALREHMKGEEHLMKLIHADLRDQFPNVCEEDKVRLAAEFKGKLIAETLALYDED